MLILSFPLVQKTPLLSQLAFGGNRPLQPSKENKVDRFVQTTKVKKPMVSKNSRLIQTLPSKQSIPEKWKAFLDREFGKSSTKWEAGLKILQMQAAKKIKVSNLPHQVTETDRNIARDAIDQADYLVKWHRDKQALEKLENKVQAYVPVSRLQEAQKELDTTQYPIFIETRAPLEERLAYVVTATPAQLGQHEIANSLFDYRAPNDKEAAQRDEALKLIAHKNPAALQQWIISSDTDKLEYFAQHIILHSIDPGKRLKVLQSMDVIQDIDATLLSLGRWMGKYGAMPGRGMPLAPKIINTIKSFEQQGFKVYDYHKLSLISNIQEGDGIWVSTPNSKEYRELPTKPSRLEIRKQLPHELKKFLAKYPLRNSNLARL
jgi:hypothetical protein